MKPWILFAIASMLFAGVTSVIAKLGMNGISSELGLAIRTIVVFLLVLLFACATVPAASLSGLTKENCLWLGLSGVTTTFSWIFYYKALKEGEVSTVALIDKGSTVVALAMAWLILKEQITARMLFGAFLMLTGLIIIAKK